MLIFLQIDRLIENLKCLMAKPSRDFILAVNADEYGTKKFQVRLNTENSFRRMLSNLNETGELKASYNSYLEDSDTEIDTESFGDSSQDSASDSDNNDPILCKFLKTELKKLNDLKDRMISYCCQIPVLGFNVSKYDINLVKTKLFKHLNMSNSSKQNFTVKKQNAYLSVATPLFKFLDITHYIAPGYSYSQFLKSYKAQEGKGFFAMTTCHHQRY